MNSWTGELTVFEVADEGDSLRVDLVGGDAQLCGSLLYEFDDDDERQRNAAVLRHWKDVGTLVLAFQEDDEVTLLDPSAVVDNLLAELFDEPCR